MKPNRRLALVGVGLLLSGAAACSSGTAAAPSRHGTPLDASTIAFLNRTGGYSSDAAFIAKAEELAQRACLRKLGLPFIAIPKEPPAAPDEQARRDLAVTYGISGNQTADLARVGRSGLGARFAVLNDTEANRAAQARRQDPATYAPAAIAAKVSAAMAGPASSLTSLTLPSGDRMQFNNKGCLAEGRAAVYGSAENFFKVQSSVDSYRLLLADKAAASSAVRDATRRWSECMAASGFDYDNPSRMNDEVFDEYVKNPATPAQREIDVATAHVRCDYQSGLTATGKTTRTAASADLSEQDQGAILSYVELQRRALERARALIGAG